MNLKVQGTRDAPDSHSSNVQHHGAAEAAALHAQHLTPPSPGGWSLWRHVECRTAGFPVATVLGFGDSNCAEAAHDLVEAQADAENVWNEIRADINVRIDRLLHGVTLLPQDARGGSPLRQEIRALRTATKSVDCRRITNDLCLCISENCARQLRFAEERQRSASEQFTHRFAIAIARSTQFATELARNDRFREAVTWQNASVLHTGLDLLADAREPSGSRLRWKLRRSEELVASYAQRYSTKNDTIGFFGPEGWAMFVTKETPIWMQSGAQLLAKRSVYFEDWAIRAIADRLSADRRFRPWLTPRQMPYLRLDGMVLSLPGGSRAKLSHDEAAVLGACDGTLTSRQIATSLMANPFLSFGSEADVLGVLDCLARSQRITWGFEVRVGDAWPERHLRTQLEAIDDHALREAAVSALDVLEAARRDLAASAGCAQSVDEAVSRMNAVFKQVSGIEATRRAGETYGARTVVYEDCQRDMKVDLGQEFANWLQPSLDLVLASARWYCHELTQRFHMAFWQIFEQTGSAQQTPERRSIDFPTFWLYAQALFFGDDPLNTDALQDELSAKWQRILNISYDSRSVHRHSAELASSIQDAFDVPNCGWRSACHQSPDIMIAASSMEAISRGECLFVLGEVHLGLNTLIVHSAVNQHPEPPALLTALRHDRGVPRIIPILSREGTQQPIRVQVVTEPGYDIELCFSYDARPLDADRALDISDLIVEEGDGALSVCTHDRRCSFDLMDVFGEFLSGYAANKFRMLKPTPYRPRVIIDKLVVQR